MRLPRLPSTAALLLLPIAVACDPVDEGPPPMTAQAQAVPPPPPAPPPPPTDAPTANADPNGMYASPEYNLGEDTDAYDDNDPTALTDFHQTLDPYGTWSDDPTYGTMWTPSPGAVGPDFTPYVTAGHWAYDDDYVWASDYSWGWAPFHYGRWVYADGRGWAWIPGRVYRGAWVGWGVDDGYGYVGWYPLAPPFLWFGGLAVAYSFPIGPRWSYCPHGAIFEPALAGRIVAGPAVVGVAARVHVMAEAGGGPMRGPEPSRLGFAAAQIPHPSGAAAAGIAHAQQFSRPSTAAALGAHPATHVASASGSLARPALTNGASPAGHGTPTAVNKTPQKKKPVPQGNAPHPASHGFRGGGGHHR
jgi:hypothetical protein